MRVISINHSFHHPSSIHPSIFHSSFSPSLSSIHPSPFAFRHDMTLSIHPYGSPSLSPLSPPSVSTSTTHSLHFNHPLFPPPPLLSPLQPPLNHPLTQPTTSPYPRPLSKSKSKSKSNPLFFFSKTQGPGTSPGQLIRLGFCVSALLTKRIRGESKGINQLEKLEKNGRRAKGENKRQDLKNTFLERKMRRHGTRTDKTSRTPSPCQPQSTCLCRWVLCRRGIGL